MIFFNYFSISISVNILYTFRKKSLKMYIVPAKIYCYNVTLIMKLYLYKSFFILERFSHQWIKMLFKVIWFNGTFSITCTFLF